MAGSGKSTLTHRLNVHCYQNSIDSYFINLDPAVANIQYGVNIDIRDTIDYKSVMRNHKIGPNSAILTCLNLFCTTFDKAIEFLEANACHSKYVFVDTPGQIEVFTWSASGTIITEVLGSTFPTTLLFTIDSVRCTEDPHCFMSCILYATSIMYKTQLPMVLLFNKKDACETKKLFEWMHDPKTFEEDMMKHSDSYASTLNRSLSVMLSEFYEAMRCLSISSGTGDGLDELFEAFDSCKLEYYDDYMPTRLKNVLKAEKKTQSQLADLEKALTRTSME
ncbi:hypothetical protein XU18_3001 [Perkinsela sp. CCAP 1560/4]|nr:hypothetical protein XU18_3001 [Perkinsela sp. CCAP 1560/4]|eukprot:KNH06064.1 hypothetical protein XU18_3001 [Perkinsela sp. CCAP 1560/4]